MTQTVVGVIGAGRMGMPIIGHLARAGFTTVVHDLSAGKRPEIEGKGASWAASLDDLARGADVVLICVGYDREVRELLADGGPLQSLRAGAIVAILSTINPRTVQELAAQLQKRNVQVVDATVTGGGSGADKGALHSFVGGDADVVARLAPVLRAYSLQITHSGGVGTAQVAKAANNLIMWSCLVADHEALALARRYGVDVEALRKALLTSTAANGSLKRWGEQTMAWADDDMEIVAEMAHDSGLKLPQATVVREICKTLKPRRYKLEEYGK